MKAISRALDLIDRAIELLFQVPAYAIYYAILGAVLAVLWLLSLRGVVLIFLIGAVKLFADQEPGWSVVMVLLAIAAWLTDDHWRRERGL